MISTQRVLRASRNVYNISCRLPRFWRQLVSLQNILHFPPAYDHGKSSSNRLWAHSSTIATYRSLLRRTFRPSLLLRGARTTQDGDATRLMRFFDDFKFYRGPELDAIVDFLTGQPTTIEAGRFLCSQPISRSHVYGLGLHTPVAFFPC